VKVPAQIKMTPTTRVFAPARLACGAKRKWTLKPKVRWGRVVNKDM